MDEPSDFDDVMALATIVAELIVALERKGLLGGPEIARVLDDALQRNHPSAARSATTALLANLVNGIRQAPLGRR